MLQLGQFLVDGVFGGQIEAHNFQNFPLEINVFFDGLVPVAESVESSDGDGVNLSLIHI